MILKYAIAGFATVLGFTAFSHSALAVSLVGDQIEVNIVRTDGFSSFTDNPTVIVPGVESTQIFTFETINAASINIDFAASSFSIELINGNIGIGFFPRNFTFTDLDFSPLATISNVLFTGGIGSFDKISFTEKRR
ncbi:hypothetical protein [Okeania hirsuta]|uniref:PEP-CTERM sorting domain-containing protein n=1 Tax=Okeania hirsuta TaxID=1458930 RepID=A0A3N6PG59_9CYAN|nr:hypothetical protein [Okeania hirsuta]RQH25144.1 hypothetical protein D4Z78_02400 [Okeania hirsuta]RQH33451.1 hypothetical protein D5R40_21755 [Okeania hirsuta]